jgi:SAM-dependent methyltransferase
MKNNILKRKRAYQASFYKHGIGPKALQWFGRESAEIRYQNLLSDIDINDKTIFDAGCGFADILPFIKNKSKNFTYTGVDIVPEFITIAQKKYPKQKFILGDWHTKISPHDIVLCSGVLNNKIKGNQYKYRKKAIKLMFDNAKEILAFNMAGGIKPKNKKNYKVYYVDCLKILKYCLSLTNKIIFRYHYRKNDFTIIMFK